MVAASAALPSNTLGNASLSFQASEPSIVVYVPVIDVSIVIPLGIILNK
jgi:hypothetical protein